MLFLSECTAKTNVTWVISFAELFGGNQAVDRVRNQHVPKIGPTLDYLGMSSRSYMSVTH